MALKCLRGRLLTAQRLKNAALLSVSVGTPDTAYDTFSSLSHLSVTNTFLSFLSIGSQ